MSGGTSQPFCCLKCFLQYLYQENLILARAIFQELNGEITKSYIKGLIICKATIPQDSPTNASLLLVGFTSLATSEFVFTKIKGRYEEEKKQYEWANISEILL